MSKNVKNGDVMNKSNQLQEEIRKVVENHGRGTIKIELKNNKIFVKHGVDDSLLFQRDSTPKTWSYLWETIKSEK